MSDKKFILDQSVAEKKLRRMALEILENNPGEEPLILAGIRESGSVVARNVQQMIAEISPVKTELLTITLDKREPREIKLSEQSDFNNKVVIIVDDVVTTAATLNACAAALLAGGARTLSYVTFGRAPAPGDR